MGQTNDTKVVAVRDLNKTYFLPERKTEFLGGLRTLLSGKRREVQAVRDLTFDILEGQLVGYIGPNGAGKSTTVKMLTGILHPTSGEARVLGLSPQSQRQRLAREIGVVFGQRTQLWWDLPTRDSFEILGTMYDVAPSRYNSVFRELRDLLGLDEFLDKPVRQLSLGQRMRADLAASLIHSPRVLFLDEPTIGLDVVAKGNVRRILARLRSEAGVTILLTTHDLRDIEELCDRVMMINHGRLIYDGDLETLRAEAALPTHLTVKYVRLPGGLVPGQYVGRGGQMSRAGDNDAWLVVSASAESGTLILEFDRKKTAVPSILSAVGSLGEVKDMSFAEPAIDDIVRRVLLTR